MSEHEERVTKKGKFSAAAVLSNQPAKAEGLLAPTKPAPKLGGRPRLDEKKRRKKRCLYLTDAEYRELSRWCDGEDVSEVLRSMVKRALRQYQSFEHLIESGYTIQRLQHE